MAVCFVTENIKGNGFITSDSDIIWKYVKSFILEPCEVDNTFAVIGKCAVYSVKKHLTDYDKNKAILREFAITWQHAVNDWNLSFYDCIVWQEFFETYGKKYGLIREFHENGIC